MNESGLALEGLRVVEYGSHVAGPYCSKLLADGGARVVKVELPEGEALRRRPPSLDGSEGYGSASLFQFLNTNKLGVTLDVHSDEGRQALWSLLSDADIFIWNGDPELGRKLRLRYRDLRKTHPHLIVTAITPFGLTGPYRNFKGDELIVHNMGGLGYASPGMPDHVDDPPTEPPLHPRAPVADIITGLVGAMATMMAVFARRQDGKGRQVDVSGMDAIASMIGRDTSIYSYIREIAGRLPNIFALQPNDMMPCKDGWVVIATPYGEHWNRFVEVMGDPDWASLEVFANGRLRGANWDALRPLIEEWSMQHTGEEIMRMAQGRSIPCFPAFTVGQMMDSDQIKSRDYFWTAPVKGKEVKLPGPPFKLTRTPHTLRTLAPELGQHNHDMGDMARRQAPPETGNPSGMPLEGIRVLDLGQVVSVPHCGRILAWMGADVIQVESSNRMTSRNSPPFAQGRQGPNTGSLYNALGTNKRSCTLDLTTPQGVELFKELVRVSDVVLENFATRTMLRFGLGYDTLKELNPSIIMLSVSAFGRTGPMKEYVGMHSAVNLFSGVGEVTGYSPDDRPRILGTILPDPVSGTAACMAILEALYYRQRTGQGQHIDLSMSETFVNFIPESVAEYSRVGHPPPAIGNRDPYKVPHGVYRCKGADHWVAISVSTEEEWQSLCSTIGQPEIAQDPLFSEPSVRWQHHDELDDIITRWTRQRSHYEAMHLLQEAGVPAGAALDPKDLLNDPHLKARRRVVWTDHPEAGRHRMVGAVWDIGNVPPLKYRHAPCIGQHTDEVLRDLLGLSEQEVERLRREKALT